MTRHKLPTAIVANSWAGRSRKCPRCGTDFVAKRNRSCCAKCGHVFLAFDVHGPPPDLDLNAIANEAAIVSDETSTWIISLLTEKAPELPERPESFDNPRLRDILRNEREMWDFEYQLMQDALDGGGELWRWSTSPGCSELLMDRCGFAVVKGGRVIAVSVTGMS